MSWNTLGDIAEENRQDRQAEEHEPPDACPYDGSPLVEDSRGVRNCPMGNYTWQRGQPRLV